MDAISSTCLRPEFSAHLRHQLLAGTSLNLISPHGQGRRRTLLDLQQNPPPPASMQIIHINMRSYKSDYKGFYEYLCAQISRLKIAPESFKKLLDNIEQRHFISLLCVSEFEHKHYRLQTNGSAYLYAFLNADSIVLPPLNSEQLLAELHRRNMPQTEQTLHTLSTHLAKQENPYSALNALFSV